MRAAETVATELLAADGPFPEHAGKLMLFGRLVGSWGIDGVLVKPDGTREEHRAEWHFGWALQGRAIQDVLISPPLDEQRRSGAPAFEYGTTIRFYDPRVDAWQITYVSPVAGGVHKLIGRPISDEIDLEGAGPDGTRERWTFLEISEETFRWRGELTEDDGRTWFQNEEMHARRRRGS